MTRDGVCGVFIPGRVVAGKWHSQRERRVAGQGGWKYKRQLLEPKMPGNYPKESIIHIKHGESLTFRLLMSTIVDIPHR